MRAYSIDLREKIVNAYEQSNISIRGIAERFDVAKSFVQKLLLQQKTEGNLKPKQQGGGKKGALDDYGSQLTEMVEKNLMLHYQNTANIGVKLMISG